MKEKNKKSFIIKYVIFSIILIGLTILAIYMTINYLEANEAQGMKKENNTVEEKKSIAIDSQYAIKSYDETYNENSIKITKYNDINGNIKEERGINDNNFIEYIQINGLLNKDIENIINEKLKQKAHDAKDSSNSVYSRVSANFSNILSVEIESELGKIETLNIDLTTGNDIPLEKVFVSSAPLNSLIADGLYKSLAWNESYKEGIEDIHDMNNYDTSEYEDKSLMLINKYNKCKDNIKYSITPYSVNIYGLLDNDIREQNEPIKLEFLENIEEIAIYKRYLTDETIYENDNLGMKGLIILTPNLENNSYYRTLTYEKIQNNIFMEEAVIGDLEAIKNSPDIFNYIKKISNEEKENLKKRNLDNNGIFFQRQYYIYDDSNFYQIHITTSESVCTKDYFIENAFKDYIRLKLRPLVEATLTMFDSEYMRDDFPNMKLSKLQQTIIYLSKDGEFLGNTEEEAMKKIQQEQNINQPQQNVVEQEEVIDEWFDNSINEDTINENQNEPPILDEETPLQPEENNQNEIVD